MKKLIIKTKQYYRDNASDPTFIKNKYEELRLTMNHQDAMKELFDFSTLSMKELEDLVRETESYKNIKTKVQRSDDNGYQVIWDNLSKVNRRKIIQREFDFASFNWMISATYEEVKKEGYELALKRGIDNLGLTTKLHSDYKEVMVFHNPDSGITLELYKESGKWYEGNCDGDLYGWGSKTYEGYLDSRDIAGFLREDYGGRWLINETESYSDDESSIVISGGDYVGKSGELIDSNDTEYLMDIEGKKVWIPKDYVSVSEITTFADSSEDLFEVIVRSSSPKKYKEESLEFIDMLVSKLTPGNFIALHNLTSLNQFDTVLTFAKMRGFKNAKFLNSIKELRGLDSVAKIRVSDGIEEYN